MQTATSTMIPEKITEMSTEHPMTATPSIPAAAIVNGEIIPLAQYESELRRYHQAQSNLETLMTDQKPEDFVLEDMVSQVLFAQGAVENGYTVDDSALQEKLNLLVNDLGGQSALDAWLSGQGYSMEEFRYSLKISMASAWMRDQITSQVPDTADQVHLRQIVFTEQANADSALQEVRAGADFATMAEEYDPITRGDIGWFPRGYLTQAVLEDVAFSMQPGEVSEVIPTTIGYHLIQVIDRDGQHALSPDAYSMMQEHALSNWLNDKKETSQIEIRIQ